MPGFSFSMVPVSGFNPQTEDQFPTGLQFQNDGVDLGLPTADTLNFGAGTTATRGTGENANVVTVVAEGGGGGSETDTLAVNLYGTTPGIFDGSTFNTWEPVDPPIQESADVGWDNDAGQLLFVTPGLYEIEIQGRVQADTGTWPNTAGSSVYGTHLSGTYGQNTSTHFLNGAPAAVGGGGTGSVVFNDRFVMRATAAMNYPIALYASNYLSSAAAVFSALVTVKRLPGIAVE